MAAVGLDTIMVALDGSGFAEGALPPARDLAKRSGARLHLVSVHEIGPTFSSDLWPTVEMDRWREDYLKEVAGKLGDETGGEVAASLPRGDVAERLLDEAQAKEADLLILSSHGRGRISGSWLGNVAASVLHRSRIPLLVIRPSEEAGEEDELAPAWAGVRNILVALDGSEESEGVMGPVLTLARLYDAAIHLVRVAPFPRAYSSPYIPHAVQINQEVVNAEEERAREYLDDAVRRLVPEGVEATADVVVTPQAARGILAEATEVEADVIALASHHGAFRRFALGSTADKVVRASHKPVLVVHTGSETED
jgi:nucleotide-binding universal stress UspA family protein